MHNGILFCLCIFSLKKDHVHPMNIYHVTLLDPSNLKIQLRKWWKAVGIKIVSQPNWLRGSWAGQTPLENVVSYLDSKTPSVLAVNLVLTIFCKYKAWFNGPPETTFPNNEGNGIYRKGWNFPSVACIFVSPVWNLHVGMTNGST